MNRMATKRINPKLVRAMVGVLCFLVTASCFGREALFYRVSTNYASGSVLGNAYRRELEPRMFRHATWRQRLYCNSDHPDIDETLEVYSNADGSRWLAYHRAEPSLSRLIRTSILGNINFNLQKQLDAVRISRHDVKLPSEVANEIELLWQAMLPGLPTETKERNESTKGTTYTIHLNPTEFIGFRKENNVVKAGRLAPAMYNTPIYHAFVEIIGDLGDVCYRDGGVTDPVFGRLPSKIQRLREHFQ